jgi:hypothetical protein
VPQHNADGEGHSGRAVFIAAAAEIGAVELELAATAAFLYSEKGNSDPWSATAQLKPDKANNGRLERAQAAYHQLLAIPTPTPLPAIA